SFGDPEKRQPPSPETARTAGGSDRPGAIKAPRLSPAFPSAFPSVLRKSVTGRQIPRIGPLHSGGTTGQLRHETAGRGRVSVPPVIEAHSGSQAVTRGELLAAGNGVLRQKNPAVFFRPGHQMPAHHLAALKHLEHRISIAALISSRHSFAKTLC